MKDKIKDKQDKKTRLLAMLSNKEDEMALKQWKSVINQMSIDGQWFKKQIGVICVAVFGIIIYITCRYQAQQEIILEEQLKIERQDWMFRSLTRPALSIRYRICLPLVVIQRLCLTHSLRLLTTRVLSATRLRTA